MFIGLKLIRPDARVHYVVLKIRADSKQLP
jgi:hypothetical protein